MQLQSGTHLKRGDYRIIDSLGRGGFGITYLAEQVNLHRRVCIKEFFPKDYYKREGVSGSLTLSSEGFGEAMNKFKAKFIKEAQTIAALDHPNIIHIHDVFEENGTVYYVMDYIEGESLSDIVKRGGALAEADALRYIREVASALEYIHDRNINHLDVKPGNIIVRRDDNCAILIDFGLSKHYDAESGEATSTTPVGVSHGFAPMEQYKQGGVSKFSPETDIYSLGATLYYLVTGKVPPQAADIAEEGILFPIHISSNVREAIERSMSYWRKDRPQSIAAFMTLLDGCCASAPADESAKMAAAVDDEKTKIVTPQLKPQPKVEQPKVHIDLEPKPKRSRWWMWLLGLLVVVGGVLSTLGGNEESTQKIKTYKVGDYYNENGKQGVVFEVSDGGRHGKIVSLNQTQAPWDSRVEWHINGTKTGANEEYNGKANTDKIMSRSDSKYFEAFVWCRNKGKDWYLPAVDELKAIYNNKSTINSTLANYGGTKLSDSWNWSSTECDDDKFCAWFVAVDGGDAGIYCKGDSNYVRAVSAF